MLGLFSKAPWRQYVCAFRESLNLWAVWLPGTQIEVGDYGILENYCFKRQGSISEFIELEIKETRTTRISKVLQLGNFGQLRGNAIVDASQSIVGSASVNLDVSTSRGVFLRINGLTETEFVAPIPIQRKLIEAIRRNGLFWKSEWFLVSEVYAADSFAILSTRERKSSLKLQGSVEALEDFNGGKVKAGVGLEIVGASDLKILGAKGPVALGLAKVQVEGFASHEYRLMSEGSVRFHSLRPKDVIFPDLEESE